MRGILFALAASFLTPWLTCYSQAKQENNNFIAPLSGNLGVTGSFGEIRGDHFHSGIDLRTDGVIGKEIFATKDGYISRIKVSPVGYGKSIFIEHSDGLTTGYGHIDRYNDKITEYVKRIQYQLKSFDVDVFPKPFEIPVKKGELIAYSGNSGGSSGPHLHYEVRTTIDQQIISPIPKYLNIIDSLPPTIRGLYIYQIDSTSFSNGYINKKSLQLTKSNGFYSVSSNVQCSAKIGIGLEVIDRLNALSTLCGFHSVTMLVNGKVYYKLLLDKFAFAETKYVNSIIDYGAKVENNQEVVKLFSEPGNFFSCLGKYQNKGYLNILPDSLYKVEIQVTDANGNRSNLKFNIIGVSRPMVLNQHISFAKNTVLLTWAMDNSVINDTFILQIPKNALYSNLYFNYSFMQNNDFKYSPVLKLHTPKVPLHIKPKLSIKSTSIPEKYQAKALFAYIDDKKNISSVFAEYKDGFVKGNISLFGNYAIVLDTVSPEIIPINIRQDANLTNANAIRLIVKDDFSGVSKIEGYIDGQWVLFDYDKKNNLIQYQFDKDRITKGKNHSLEVIVKDSKENESRYNCNFIW